MNTNAKKILLTGTAFLAVSLAGVGSAHAQQPVGAGAPTPITLVDGAGAGVNFTADGTGTVANGVNIGGPVTNVTADHGTLQFAGDSTVTGAVGAGGGPPGPIKAIEINGGNNTAVVFSGGAVNAGTMTFGGAGGATLNGTTTLTGALGLGTGSLTIGSGNTVTAGSVTGTGTLRFTNGGQLNSGGAIELNSVISSDGTTSIGGAGAATITAVGVAVSVSGGHLTISNAGSSVSGMTAIAGNQLTFGGSGLGVVTGAGGTLNLNGTTGTQTVSGTIGASGTELNTVALTGAAEKILNGEVRATTLSATSTTVNGTGAIHTTNLNTNAATMGGTGAITTTNLTNAAGTTNISKAVNATSVTNTAGDLTLSGVAAIANGVTVNGGTVSVTNASSTIGGTSAIGVTALTFGGSSIGAVTGSGTLNLASGDTTTIGAIGTGVQSLATVSIGTGTKTFGTNLYTNTLSFTGAGSANLAATTTADAQSINFAGHNGTVTYGASKTYTGSATTTSSSTGNMVFGDNATIGAAAVLGGDPNTLNSLSFAGGANTITAGSTIHVATVHTGAGTLAANETINGAVRFSAADGTTAANGVVNLADGKSITGAITTASNGTGTLNLLGAAHTVAGAIGTNAARLATVSTANNTGTTVFTGGVNANTLTIENGGAVTVNGNSNITNAITLGSGLLTIGSNATFTAEGGLAAGTNNVTLNNGTFATNVASNIATLTSDGTSAVDGSAATTITTANVGSGTLSIKSGGSTVTAATLTGATTTLEVDATTATIGTVDGAGAGQGILKLTSGTTGVGAVGGTHALASVDIGAGTKTFAATMNAGELTFSGAGTADLTATTTANAQTIKFAGNNGTVIYGGSTAYSGAVTGTGGNGNVTFGDGATVTGTLGASGSKIGAVTFAGGTNSLSTALYATTLNVGAGGLTTTDTTLDTNVNFTADSTLRVANDTKITGNVGGTAGTGTIVFAGGGLIIDGNLDRLKALSLTANATVGGTAIAANTMDIGIHTLTVNGNSFTTTANAGATERLNFSVFNNTGGSGKIVGAANTVLTIVDNTKVNVSVDTADVIVQGQEYVLISSANAGNTIGVLGANLTTTNTALLHFRQKLVSTGLNDGTKNLVVYADRTQMSSVTVDPNNGAVGKMLDALGADGDADVDALQVRLANFGVGQNAAVEQVLSTLVPNVSGATVATTANLGAATSTIVNNRVGSVRNGGTYGSGTSSGNELDGKNFWGQVFGASADQSRRGNVAGYDAESFGAVFGVDADVMDNLRAGIAFAYADTDVSGEDSNRTSTNIDSYQVSLYADWNLPNQYFVSGQLAYMYNDIETARHGVGGLAGNTARADFHSDQYTVRAEAGRSFAVERGISLTPSALVNYNYIDVEDFSETGVGGLGLRNVQTDEMQILEFGVNLMAEMNLDDGHGGIVTPNLHGGYRYDVIGDDVATSARLAGGGTAFKTQGADAAQGTANIGTGVKWSTASNLDLSVNYDFEGKSDYRAHSGYVRAGYKF